LISKEEERNKINDDKVKYEYEVVIKIQIKALSIIGF